MARLARDGAKLPRLARLAQSLVRFNNKDATIGAIEGFVRARFRYTGEDVETLRTVERMLEDLDSTGLITGDCDDVSIFLGALLCVCSIPCTFVAIRTKPQPDYLHVFVVARSPNAVHRLDVTVSPLQVMNYYGDRMEVTV